MNYDTISLSKGIAAQVGCDNKLKRDFLHPFLNNSILTSEEYKRDNRSCMS